eukprot:CAMPEP_0115242716 /NCGR_PEP_ID=MMETSP0270-20121206/39100_1 /TAXON_ID=71861 /ORGANISM="Scrippsiella trochoidea, Strain CCMP3099" /LENGTH=92 /DNA_ID=CAMNT_0002657799 /DNA_START=480 /DNA_END=757 /DNA_ORIENTATION=-
MHNDAAASPAATSDRCGAPAVLSSGDLFGGRARAATCLGSSLGKVGPRPSGVSAAVGAPIAMATSLVGVAGAAGPATAVATVAVADAAAAAA